MCTVGLMRQITLKNELVSGVLFGLFLGNLSPVFQQVQKQVRFSTHAFPSAGVFLCRRKEKGGEGLLKHAGWLPIIKGAKQGKFQSSLKWWAEELYIPSKITIWLWEERWARVKYCRWALMWHRCTSRSMRKPCLLWEEVSRVNAHTCSHTWDRKRERERQSKKRVKRDGRSAFGGWRDHECNSKTTRSTQRGVFTFMGIVLYFL